MSASGKSAIKINSRERAISVDINRLQNQGAKSDQDLLLAEQETLFLRDTNGLGNNFFPFGAALTPPQATVYGGLVPVPQNGTFNLLVTAGSLCVYAPDSPTDPDQSSYKRVNDPGVSVIGALVVAPNAGPGMRIDVLECQPTEQVLETDNRDIFDPSAGLFFPATVDKLITKRLAYRIRQGVAGNGYPGSVAGWTPLAIVAIPVGALNLDTCEIWDVRPLLFGKGIGKGFFFNHHLSRSIVSMDSITVPAERRIKGYIEADSGFGWPSGGHLRIGAYGAVSTYTPGLNVLDSTNLWEPGFAPVAGTLWYLYAVMPHTLPRWAKYSRGVNPRAPMNPEGIYIISNKAPDAYNGFNTNLVLPAALGFGAGAHGGICIASGVCFDPGTGLILGIPVSDGEWHYMEGEPQPPAAASLNAATVNALNQNNRIYDLVPGTTHPPMAKGVVIQFRVDINPGAPITAAFQNLFKLYDSTGSEVRFSRVNPYIQIDFPAAAGIIALDVEFPLYPGEAHRVEHFFGLPGGVPVTATTARVRGWKLLR